MLNKRGKKGITSAAERSSKTLPVCNLYFHLPAVNTTSIVIQGKTGALL